MRDRRVHRSIRGICATAIVTLGIVLSQAVAAQVVQIDQTIPFDPQGDVNVEVVTHGVVLEAWDRAEIQVVGEYDSTVDELEIESSSDAFDLEMSFVDPGSRDRPQGSRELIVRLPVGASVSVESVSGGVRIARSSGVSGGSESVVLESVSGSIVFEGEAAEVSLSSVSGSIRLVGTAEEVEIETVSGRIEVDGRAQGLDAETVSGRTTVTTDGSIQSLSLQSVSGSLDFDGALASGGRVDVDSFSGSVELMLRATPDAEFRLETFSGSLSWDLTGVADATVRESRFSPGESASFRVGDGSGDVDVTTHSGSVTIRGP